MALEQRWYDFFEFMSRGVKTVTDCTLNPFRNSELYTLACDFATEQPGDPINITVLSIVGVNRIIIRTNKRKNKTKKKRIMLIPLKHHHKKASFVYLKCWLASSRSPNQSQAYSVAFDLTRMERRVTPVSSLNRCHDTWYDDNINTKMFNLGSDYYCMDLYAAAYICIFIPAVSRTHA